MGRVGRRALLALAGTGLLTVYAGVAYLGYRLLVAFWLVRGDVLAVVAWTTGLAVALGYLSYRFGTAQLLASLDAADWR